MMAHAQIIPEHPVDARYLDLIHRFALRPIHDDDELEQASAMADALVIRSDLSKAEEDYLAVLSTLIERYEAEHHPMSDATTPAEFLRDLLEVSGMTSYRLAAETGIGVSTLSEILSGKSGVSPRVRKILAAHFHVEEAAFI
jgi:HTH-type transcriptional regulator/antitoxin HigA